MGTSRIEYVLKRSVRKSAGIYIIDGIVEVRVPLYYSESNIDEFIRSREKWISDHLAGSKEQAAKRADFSVTYGSRITYRGNLYTVAAEQDGKTGFTDAFCYVPPNLTPEQIKQACISCYRQCAETVFIDRIAEYAWQMFAFPHNVRINNAKARWGSCSSKRIVNIAWRLIMADDAAIDYLIVHELAHIKVYNHSAGFWALVESYIPDYKECRKRLKALECKLGSENWD